MVNLSRDHAVSLNPRSIGKAVVVDKFLHTLHGVREEIGRSRFSGKHGYRSGPVVNQFDKCRNVALRKRNGISHVIHRTPSVILDVRNVQMLKIVIDVFPFRNSVFHKNLTGNDDGVSTPADFVVFFKIEQRRNERLSILIVRLFYFFNFVSRMSIPIVSVFDHVDQFVFVRERSIVHIVHVLDSHVEIRHELFVIRKRISST